MEEHAKPSCSVKKRKNANLDHTCVRKLARIKETENIQKALSIAPIMQEIFGNLTIHDLNACGKVNINWESEADISMRQFNIEFFSTNALLGNDNGIYVQEITGLLRDTHKKKLTNFRDLVSLITRATKKRTICQPYIALRLNQCKIENMELIKFLEIFGHLVFRLNYSQDKYENPHKFCQFLWNHLPNLVELHMDDFLLGTANEPVIPQEDQKYLKALTTISFFKGNPSFAQRFQSPDGSFLLILNMAPNLQIIERFPLERAHLLPPTGKLNLVREMQIPDNRVEGRHIKLWLENLSNIAPQLSKFKFPTTSHNIFQPCINYVTRILESSRQSLEHLVVFPKQVYDYLHFPFQFPGLRVLEFANQTRTLHGRRVGRTRCRGFLRSEVDLKQKFPTLQEIKISLEEVNPDNVQEYFPLETFQKLEVPRLHVNRQAAFCLGYLCNIFGSVDHLTIDITKMKIQGLKRIIHNISRFPYLKCLRLEINSQYFFYDDGDGKVSHEVGVFDSILTGIPEHICEKLRDPKNFDDVNDLLTELCLLGIQGLTNLEFIFTNNRSHYRCEWKDYFPVSLFSDVSYFYGLRMYPHVQVAVRVEDEHPKIHTDKMIKAVEDILDEIELDMSYKVTNFLSE